MSRLEYSAECQALKNNFLKHFQGSCKFIGTFKERYREVPRALHPVSPNVDMLHIKRKYAKSGNIPTIKLTVQSIELFQISLVIYGLICVCMCVYISACYICVYIYTPHISVYVTTIKIKIHNCPIVAKLPHAPSL